MTSPAIAFYGDDFTGATDTLATATAAGLRSLLFLRVPDDALLAAAGPLDVLGVAGASRSMAPDAMRAALAPVRDCFARLAPRIVHYKVCSTFDSAPGIGNIAVAIDALRPLAPRNPVAIVGGQPNLDRYCLFGHLFAARVTGGEVFRIDRHPTMRRHPVTPMDEADLRRHLERQGLAAIASIEYTRLGGGVDRLERLCREQLHAPATTLLFDVSRADDLPAIGALLWRLAGIGGDDRLLVVGPSGATQALAAAWPFAAHGRASSIPDPAAMPIPPSDGPVLVVVGSLSPVSRAQRDAATAFHRIAIDPGRLVAAGPDGVRAAIAEAAATIRAGRHVLLSTAPEDATVVPRADPALATATGQLLRRLLDEAPVRRIGIAGGDTSSHAVAALDLWALAWAGQIAPGVPLCRARSTDPTLDGLELMLKGGQMGQTDLFDRLAG